MAATRRRKAAPAAPVEEIEGDAFEELDDLEDDVEEAPAAKPAKRTRRTRTAEPVEEVEEAPRRARKAAPAKAAASAEDTGASEFNTSWLAEYASEVTGVDMDGRAARMLLRKMASDGDLDRTVGEDRGRYTFPKGANDPTVKKFISRVKNGDMTSARREGLEKVTTRKKAAAPVEDEAPAPRRSRKAPATKAAPAKATPARTRRTRAAAE